MALRNRRDRRTLLWAAAMPIVAAAQYVRPSLIPFLAPVAFYLALCAGVMAHNHNHRPTFVGRKANRLYGHWLSVFYGYPTFAWVPTHNLNHHRFVNRPGDATITWRYSERHVLPVALTYFFVSAYWQSDPIKAYIRKAREKNPSLHRQIVFQYAIWIGLALALLGASMLLHGPAAGTIVWLAASAAPALFALWAIMLLNYEQHVHADPWSEHDHSRSWTSPVLNFLLFNNGFHAAHHENPGLHWSELPREHDRLAPKIHPDLVERGMTWYFVKTYLLAPFAPRFGTRQVGRSGSTVAGDARPDLSCVEPELGEAGDNATFVGHAQAPTPTSS